ncbi:LOW QUALITY PROTEIN: ovochymase-1 [Ara ararauna]
MTPRLGYCMASGWGKVDPAGMPSMQMRPLLSFFPARNNSGHSFELIFTANCKNSKAGLGCGSVTMLVEEGKMDTANPGLDPRNMECRWLIEGPAEYVIKYLVPLEGECKVFCNSHHYVAKCVIGTPDPTSWSKALLSHGELAANLCGFPAPKPVMNSGNTMSVHFENDGENSFRQFRAWLTFVHSDICDLLPVIPLCLFKHVSWAEEACPHSWPWQAVLKIFGGYQYDGAVISPGWLLAATHFVQLQSWCIPDLTCYDSDTVLMQLDVPLEYNTAVGPVFLPNGTNMFSSSSPCTVSGWGIIEEADMSAVLENEICERSYYFSYPRGITGRMLRAGFVSVGGQDSSQARAGLRQRLHALFCKRLFLWANLICDSFLLAASVWRPNNVMASPLAFGSECVSEVELEEPWGFISAPSSSGYVGSTEYSWILLSLKGMAKIIVKHLSITSSLNQELFLGIYEESQRGRKVLGTSVHVRKLGKFLKECQERIIVPLKSIIQLEVLNFWTERSLSNCPVQLMVYEGLEESFSMCSSSSFPTLHFKTDDSVGHRGFKILLEELYQQPTQSELEGSSQRDTGDVRLNAAGAEFVCILSDRPSAKV